MVRFATTGVDPSGSPFSDQVGWNAFLSLFEAVKDLRVLLLWFGNPSVVVPSWCRDDVAASFYLLRVCSVMSFSFGLSRSRLFLYPTRASRLHLSAGVSES